MDDPPRERYSASDVMRATEAVAAPVEGDPLMTEPAPGFEETRTRAFEGFDMGAKAGRFFFGASFFGWNVAAFWTLLFTGLLAAVMGATAFRGSAPGGLDLLVTANLTAAAIAGFLGATLVAYFIGGFVAGRIARGAGAANGAGVALWGVFAVIVLGVLATALAPTFNLAAYAQIYNVNWRALPLRTILVGALTLIAMFTGGVIGGLVGARRDVLLRETSRISGTYRRGRPL